MFCFLISVPWCISDKLLRLIVTHKWGGGGGSKVFEKIVFGLGGVLSLSDMWRRLPHGVQRWGSEIRDDLGHFTSELLSPLLSCSFLLQRLRKTPPSRETSAHHSPETRAHTHAHTRGKKQKKTKLNSLNDANELWKSARLCSWHSADMLFPSPHIIAFVLAWMPERGQTAHGHSPVTLRRCTLSRQHAHAFRHLDLHASKVTTPARARTDATAWAVRGADNAFNLCLR